MISSETEAVRRYLPSLGIGKPSISITILRYINHLKGLICAYHCCNGFSGLECRLVNLCQSDNIVNMVIFVHACPQQLLRQEPEQQGSTTHVQSNNRKLSWKKIYGLIMFITYRWSTKTNFPSIVCRDMNSTFIERGRAAASLTALSLPGTDPLV